MKDEEKTKDQTMIELALLRKRIAELEKAASECKQPEDALRHQSEFLEILLETIPNPIFYKGADGKYTGCNRAFEKFLGRPRQEIIGKTVYDMGAKEIADKYNQKDKELYDHPGEQRYEWRVERKDGEIREVIFDKAAIIDREGRFEGLVGVISDITDRKRTEAELDRYRDHLEDLVKERTAALAKVNEQLQREIEERKKAEQALQESQQMLQSVLDTIPVRVFWKNPDLNYLGCNRPFALDAGLQSPEEIIGRNDFDMDWADQAERYRSDDRLVMKTGRPKLGYEEPLTTADGQRSWVLTNKVPLLDAEGEIKGVLGTYEDITKSKQMEEALRESETKYRIVADNTYDWEHWIGPEGQLLYTSPSCERITGYPVGQFEKDPTLLSNIVHPHDLSQYMSHIAQGHTTNAAFEMEFRIIHCDGTMRWIGHACQPVFNAQGTFLGRRGSNRDITERKLAEEKLKAVSLYTRSLIEASLDPLVTISPEGKITDANRATEQVTGASREHLIGDDFSNYFTEPEKARDGYQKVLDDGWVRDYELTIQHTSGKTTDVLYNAALYKNELGEIQGVFAAARDITERKRAEQALQESSQKLKLFAYSVAHDLKSPAIGIYGLTKRLSKHAKDVLDDKGKSYCDQILKVSEHIAALIDKINVYIATKEARLSIERISIAEILQMLKEEFSAQLSIRQIDWLEPEALLEINADRLSILRAFRNFVDNSLKYGGERLSKIWSGYEESEDFHIFSFSDNGKGLKEEDSGKIFGAFQRHETSKGVEGAGLGLTIVKEIAEQHGGRVWVEPRGKKGITFYISISKNLD